MSNEGTPIVWLDDDAIKHPALRLSEQDNVGVALRTLKESEQVQVDGITCNQLIPKGHKVALAPIAAGGRVLKYAQTIGIARSDIAAGDHIHTHNLDFQNNDAAHEFCSEVPELSVSSSDVFQGISEEELAQFPNVDGLAAFTHGTGCGMATQGEGWDNLQRVLAGYATHPNIGGVLFVGLGCEASQIESTLSQHALSRGPLLCTMNIQTSGGHKKTVERGRQHLLSMLPEVNKISRQSCPVSSLMLALQCGGSDAWSGITANPALGYASDLLVAQGGTAVLAETPEIYGAEHLLTRRAVDSSVAENLMERIAWWQDYVSRHNGSLDNNPSPGNKLGGLTTILEKSLGAVAKGGTSPLAGVFKYAQTVDRSGFVFMDSPGYDPASVTGQVAGGCNLVSFTTGRGSTFGCKPSPSLKIATNTDMYSQLEDDMDINAGTIVSDGQSVAEVGQQIYDKLLRVASGEKTLSEKHGLGDNEFVPWQIGATM